MTQDIVSQTGASYVIFKGDACYFCLFSRHPDRSELVWLKEYSIESSAVHSINSRDVLARA